MTYEGIILSDTFCISINCSVSQKRLIWLLVFTIIFFRFKISFIVIFFFLYHRLYPNGDGMGKNTHISIFFAILKGDYDAILTWPFSKRVIFTVFDQSGGAPVRDSFRTDPKSSSFKRPTSDMNIASGCPLFLPLSRLQGKDGFVKDNVMFIKTQVEEIP